MGGNDPDSYYALSWHGEVIKFTAYEEARGNKQNGVVMSWTIVDIKIPQNLDSRRMEIIELLKEAMDAMGWLFDRDIVKEVHIEFVEGAFE